MAQHAGAGCTFVYPALRAVLTRSVAQLPATGCLLSAAQHAIQRCDVRIPVQGAKRLQAEFKYLTKQIAAGTVTQMHDLTPVADNIFKWQACIHSWASHLCWQHLTCPGAAPAFATPGLSNPQTLRHSTCSSN